MIFAVFDAWLLTQWVNWSFCHLFLLNGNTKSYTVSNGDIANDFY